jgi:hypothetical protein
MFCSLRRLPAHTIVMGSVTVSNFSLSSSIVRLTSRSTRPCTRSFQSFAAPSLTCGTAPCERTYMSDCGVRKPVLRISISGGSVLSGCLPVRRML